jgi:hypothetical protein
MVIEGAGNPTGYNLKRLSAILSEVLVFQQLPQNANRIPV